LYPSCQGIFEVHYKNAIVINPKNVIRKGSVLSGFDLIVFFR